MPTALNFDLERFPTHCMGKRHWVEWTGDERPTQIHLIVEYGGPLEPGGSVVPWGTIKVVINPGLLQQWGVEDHEAYFLQAVEWIDSTHPTTDELIEHVDMKQLEQFWFPRMNMDIEV